MQSDTSSHAISWQVRTPCEPFKKIYMFFFDYWTVFSTLIQFIHELAPRSLWFTTYPVNNKLISLNPAIIGYYMWMFTTVVKLRLVICEASVSFPNEEVSCDEGNGIRNLKATAPPKIIRDITRGISRFTIRALFCAEVRLRLLFILAVASDSISFWWLSNSNEAFTSFGSKVSRNWELLASMWFRNGSDELLLIQLARIKSEKKNDK